MIHSHNLLNPCAIFFHPLKRFIRRKVLVSHDSIHHVDLLRYYFFSSWVKIWTILIELKVSLEQALEVFELVLNYDDDGYLETRHWTMNC